MKLNEIQKVIAENWMEVVSKNALEEIADIIITDAIRRVDCEGGKFNEDDILAVGRDQGYQNATQALERMKKDYES